MKSRALFAVVLLLILLLAGAAVFLTRMLMELATPGSGRATLTHTRPPRRPSHAEASAVIEVGGTPRPADNRGARTPATADGFEPGIAPTERVPDEHGRYAAVEGGSLPAMPTFCRQFGDQIVTRPRYPYAMEMTPDFRSDGVHFTLVATAPTAPTASATNAHAGASTPETAAP